MPAPDFNFYLVTDRTQTRGRDLLSVLKQALDGGVRAVQLREKDLQSRDLFLLAEKVRELCSRYKAALLVNDRVDIARAVDADGVQLGSASLPIETARQLLGPKRMIGASTHSLEESRQAKHRGADFVVFGPLYFTPSKAVYGAPQGLVALKKIVENIALPVYAIGGVKPENIEEVMDTGATGVALISAVMATADPKDASTTIRRLLVNRK